MQLGIIRHPYLHWRKHTSMIQIKKRHKTERIEPADTVLNVVSRLYTDYVVFKLCFCGNSATILKALHIFLS